MRIGAKQAIFIRRGDLNEAVYIILSELFDLPQLFPWAVFDLSMPTTRDLFR
jgi:hypothetical protein